jgi:hypothetical protein
LRIFLFSKNVVQMKRALVSMSASKPPFKRRRLNYAQCKQHTEDNDGEFGRETRLASWCEHGRVSAVGVVLRLDWRVKRSSRILARALIRALHANQQAVVQELICAGVATVMKEPHRLAAALLVRDTVAARERHGRGELVQIATAIAEQHLRNNNLDLSERWRAVADLMGTKRGLPFRPSFCSTLAQRIFVSERSVGAFDVYVPAFDSDVFTADAIEAMARFGAVFVSKGQLVRAMTTATNKFSTVGGLSARVLTAALLGWRWFRGEQLQSQCMFDSYDLRRVVRHGSIETALERVDLISTHMDRPVDLVEDLCPRRPEENSRLARLVPYLHCRFTFSSACMQTSSEIDRLFCSIRQQTSARVNERQLVHACLDDCLSGTPRELFKLISDYLLSPLESLIDFHSDIPVCVRETCKRLCKTSTCLKTL